MQVLPTGERRVGPPRSKPGDAIELRAEVDPIVSLIACSAEMSNNCRFNPIEYEILPHAVRSDARRCEGAQQSDGVVL